MRTHGSILAPSFKLLNDWKDKKYFGGIYRKIHKRNIRKFRRHTIYEKNKRIKQTNDIYLVCACHNNKNNATDLFNRYD